MFSLYKRNRSLFWSLVWFNLVRATSRGGDYIISTTLLSLWGDTWFLLCIGIASVFNGSVEYIGQKYLVFTHIVRKQKKFFKEAKLYALVRGAFGALGFAAVTILYFGLKIPYGTSAAIVMVVMWIISYPISKSVFVDSSRGLPIPIRKSWIMARKRVRS